MPISISKKAIGFCDSRFVFRKLFPSKQFPTLCAKGGAKYFFSRSLRLVRLNTKFRPSRIAIYTGKNFFRFDLNLRCLVCVWLLMAVLVNMGLRSISLRKIRKKALVNGYFKFVFFS